MNFRQNQSFLSVRIKMKVAPPNFPIPPKWSFLTHSETLAFANYGRIKSLNHQVSVNSLNGILLVNFPEKEKNFLLKNLAAEKKIPLITQSAGLLLKDPRNLLGVDDPIQVLFDKVKASVPCICVRVVKKSQDVKDL